MVNRRTHHNSSFLRNCPRNYYHHHPGRLRRRFPVYSRHNLLNQNMTKRLLLFSLILITLSAAIFSACSSNTFRAEQAGKAMAEVNCLIFTSTDLLAYDEEAVDEILQKYGFENETEIEEYMVSIKGTTELNEVAVNVRSHLQETCGTELEAIGLSPEDIYESKVLE